LGFALSEALALFTFFFGLCALSKCCSSLGH